MVTRRRFLQSSLGLAGLSLVAGCGVPSWLKPAKLPRIGMVHSSTPEGAAEGFEATRQGLREHGYEEGQNILIEWRTLDNRPERAPELIDELLRLGVAAIFSSSPPVILAAKRATNTVPIILAGAFTDPIGQGAVTSLNRPGGNVTGLSIAVPTLGDKRLQVLKDAVPGVRRLGLLWDRNLGQAGMDAIPGREAAARALGMDPHSFVVEHAEEIEPAFAAMQAAGVDAMHMSDGSLHSAQARLIADLALQYRLPSSGGQPRLARAGMLIMIGVNSIDLQRRATGHLDKVLKGAYPGDLPVEQPTAFDFIINLRTARALGLAIPRSVLDQATEVIS